MKHHSLRSLFALAALIFVPAAFSQVEAKTYTIQDGSKPWYDRDNWTLVQVPESLKSAEPVPQQNCTSRSLDIPGKPASVLIGVAEKDLAKFVVQYPTAVKSTDILTITNTKGGTSKYTVFTLSQPPAKIGGTGFIAGLILVKVSAE